MYCFGKTDFMIPTKNLEAIFPKFSEIFGQGFESQINCFPYFTRLASLGTSLIREEHLYDRISDLQKVLQVF